MPFPVLPFPVLSLFRTCILLSCDGSCLWRTQCRSCVLCCSFIPSPGHSLPFVGQLGMRDGCQKTSLLRKQGLSACLLYPEMQYLDFLWRSNKGNAHGFYSMSGSWRAGCTSVWISSLLASSLLDSGMNMDMGANLLSSGQALLFLDWLPIPCCSLCRGVGYISCLPGRWL